MRFSLSEAPLDAARLRAELSGGPAGALVVFEGWVRASGEGRRVASLEYEAQSKLAIEEGLRILQESSGRFGILDAVCEHRLGRLEPGELAVWLGVSARHRAEAFEACRHAIDQIKSRVPIWKKESYSDGSHHWINSAG